MPWFLLLIAIALLALWLGVQPTLRALRRRRLQQQPFPSAWQALLTRRLPVYRHLPAALKHQLHAHIRVFLAEKPFTGCNGLEVTEAMRLIIAAQACLLLCNRNSGYFPALTAILVYPGAFVVERDTHDEHGIHYRERRVLSGESWDAGKVVLAWEDVEYGLTVQDRAFNVVLHEFAHQLDQENGAANGAPLLRGRKAYLAWARVMQAAYDTHCRKVRRQQPDVLDAYAAESPAEFFAVATETFFQQPYALRQGYPGVYELLCGYYGVDPAGFYTSTHINP